ncbi:sulfonate ABC transporter substrate-binding protein [Pluralibacter gergoviae]|uniref:sulfonate ABC transporter substrate-binding protein n=1 Tax=Pluralibacter gergoviae TaxID=61647 RepID=UPI000A392C34|nr:sulfonate ABC transporter substrate-binding protein [Pluralibacter gergoviae]EKT9641030.1 sulfonate ABC transporter substrate-binding protein [Pluralibacter gergoviae]EKV3543636.1 sulfonate ABC transporter substrate-binding protein [Pluralibacter gergoviae]EKV9897535.1 sulfonate ABC transporter substrate-binding protein [Pluralibacter gergoviae]EKV9930012.1 sulfonate ABC transporter substrate-binding protein [Pluralibacter gergoviae]EKW9975642.1 sulfonate ABC transporter substrate-binding p
MPKLPRLTILLLLALSASAAAKAPETVNIGYQKANIFALLKYRGTLDETFKKQGIAVRWVEFPAGPQMLEGLNVGSIDLAATGDAPPAFAQAAKADLVYLGHSPANPKTEAIVVPENSAIKTVADLKGKRVGLNKGSDVNYLLVKALEEAGLTYKDITPVYLPPADARAAFQRGAIDAWVIWDPYLAEVETNARARQIRNAEGLVPHYTFYLASRKFAETAPDAAKQVLDELGKLSDWANAHQQDAAGILSASTGLDKGIWQKAIARSPYGAERMTPEVYDQQQALADTFTGIGLLPVKVDVRSATWSLDKQ